MLNILADDIEETPEFGADISTEFILGMGKIKGSVKILLDIDKVLSYQEISEIKKTTIADATI